MRTIRSVLWIGSARSLEGSRVADAASLDIAWAPDVEGALELPLNCFDGVILDGPDHRLVPYRAGHNPVSRVFLRGREIPA